MCFLSIVTAMMFTSNYMNMLIICSALGVGKGIRSVYMSIVIPSYIPIDRLASASAIQLFGNGLVMMCIGPILGLYTRLFAMINCDETYVTSIILGLIKDISGSYVGCILFLNICTLITITMYSIELTYTSCKKKSSCSDQSSS